MSLIQPRGLVDNLQGSFTCFNLRSGCRTVIIGSPDLETIDP